MAAADAASERRRDRVRRHFRRYVPVPLSVRTGDLPKRAASAAVMLLVAGGALWAGGLAWRVLVVGVGLACYVEFARLVLRATGRAYVRAPALILGALYMAQATILLSETRMGPILDDVGGNSAALGLLSVLAILGVVICTDTGAYFAGRAIGGPKIAPRISPSKTWAGLAGGMLLAAIWGAVVVHLYDGALPRGDGYWTIWRHAAFSACCAFLAVIAQCGDFFESWLKRKAGVKDSSNLIPGHGGIFDRVDGLIPVAFVSTFMPAPLGSWLL